MSKFDRKMARKFAKQIAKNDPWDCPKDFRNPFSQVEVCFGEVDENGDDIVYDLMSFSTEELNSKLENMSKGAK